MKPRPRPSPALGPQIRSSNFDCRSGGFPAADSFSADKGRLESRPSGDATGDNYSSPGKGTRDFDTIPHPELLKCLVRRISDGAMLALLKQWLQMPVEA